ncbi:uncharacterized protein PHALS_07814 [Plasmopara halstedii]|uniref:Uncharacterized protein n=1 Tax=Plasmopara halstedii TaxID=4781 RepID=A0A0P1B7X4_PLAHL|nr:uncharacterized protein PHALS_07814 [Plasmopara halstedii]CEG50087.1 hypothetical protein PHALS_07814 [Plasmopara halstedii]|eukprot:XP_024586456.1 hypothetical protein PHALS_07814 [Plasmopara halstedii]
MDMLMDNPATIVQDFAKKGVIVPKYVARVESLADLLTKSLPASRMKELREKVGLVDIE